MEYRNSPINILVQYLQNSGDAVNRTRGRKLSSIKKALWFQSKSLFPCLRLTGHILLCFIAKKISFSLKIVPQRRGVKDIVLPQPLSIAGTATSLLQNSIHSTNPTETNVRTSNIYITGFRVKRLNNRTRSVRFF